MNDYETDYETDEMESLSELLEGLESDEFDELAERRRRRRGQRGSVRTPSTRSSLPPPTSSDVYVKKSELARAIMTVDAKIKTTSEAITKVNARVNTLADQQVIQATALKKERRARMKADAEQKNTLVLITAAALFLKPKSVEVAPAAGGAPVKVLVEEDGFKSFVPIALALFGGQISGLLGGLEGGSSGSGSSSP